MGVHGNDFHPFPVGKAGDALSHRLPYNGFVVPLARSPSKSLNHLPEIIYRLDTLCLFPLRARHRYLTQRLSFERGDNLEQNYLGILSQLRLYFGDYHFGFSGAIQGNEHLPVHGTPPFVLEERANDYLFLGLDSAEPVKGSLRN